MRKSLFLTVCLTALIGAATPTGAPQAKSPDRIIEAYTLAVGGEAAVARIQTREVHAKRHHGPKVTYYWQKPNKVLLVEGKKKTGFDGNSGWLLSSKRRVTKISKGAQVVLLEDADPLRYTHLKQLYPDVKQTVPSSLDGRPMDVLETENDLGATKFYFDRATHLLVHIEETGETSAYFKYLTDFSDYQDRDGVKLPMRIVHNSTEPDAKEIELRIVNVIQNEPLKADIFTKPSSGTFVYGGKR